MRHSRNWTNSNVLVDEVVGREIYECIIWLDWVVVCPLAQRRQLVHCHALHSLKYFYQVLWLFLKLWIISQCVELAVDSSGPAGYLIIDNIDLLELLLQLVVVSRLSANHFLHFEDVFVLELRVFTLLSSCSIGLRVNLKIMKSISKHLVVLLQDVNFLVAVVDVLEQVGVGLLASQETLH